MQLIQPSQLKCTTLIISLLLSFSCGSILNDGSDFRGYQGTYVNLMVKPDSPADMISQELVSLLELTYQRAISKLGVPSFNLSITYYLFDNPLTLTHGGEAAYALPSSSTVQMPFDDDLANAIASGNSQYFFEVMTHENTHIIAENLFGPTYSPFFLEGLPEAIGNSQIHNNARFYVNGNYDMLSITTSSVLEFYSNAGLNYALSGSLVAYLIEIYGIKNVTVAYQTLNPNNFADGFESIFSQSFTEVVNAWKTYVRLR